MHFVHSHVEFFPENIGGVSNEQREKFQVQVRVFLPQNFRNVNDQSK